MALLEGDNFNDLEDNPLLEESNKMHKELESIELQPACIICKERWYDTPISKIKKMCQRCLNESQKVKPNKKGKKILTFSAENEMHPDNVPECIRRLSFIELASIRLVQPMLHIVQTKGNSTKMKGHSIALEQDISEFASRLPNLPENLPILILRTRNEKNPKKFKANGHHIIEALLWLKENNEFYEHIEIDKEAAMKNYPPNEFIEGIPEHFLEDTGIVNEPQNPTMINEMDEINQILQQEFDIDNDIPPPESVVQQKFFKTNYYGINATG